MTLSTDAGQPRLRLLADEDIPPLASACAYLDPWKSLGYSAQGLASYLQRQDPSRLCYVIETNQSPAGLMVIRSPWLRGPFIEMLAVLPDFQGQGLGRMLVHHAVTLGSAPNLWATVSAFNHAARQFYQQLGFQETAPLDDLIAPGESEILLRFRRSPAKSAS